MKYGLDLICASCGDQETLLQGDICNIIEMTPQCGMCEISNAYSYFWRNYPENALGMRDFYNNKENK